MRILELLRPQAPTWDRGVMLMHLKVMPYDELVSSMAPPRTTTKPINSEKGLSRIAEPKGASGPGPVEKSSSEIAALETATVSENKTGPGVGETADTVGRTAAQAASHTSSVEAQGTQDAQAAWHVQGAQDVQTAEQTVKRKKRRTPKPHGKRGKRNQFFVSSDLHPQTIDVIKTRAGPIGIELIIGDHSTVDCDVGRPARTPGAVDHCATTNYQVMHVVSTAGTGLVVQSSMLDENR